MRPAAQHLPSTKLGLAPPPRQTAPRQGASEPAAEAPRSRRTWLVLAVLLVLAGAATIVIALVGT